MNRPLKEHYEMDTDAGTTWAIFDYAADLERYADYLEQQVKNLNIPAVSNLLCGSFEPDNNTSSATKCKCGYEKWEHPKAT